MFSVTGAGAIGSSGRGAGRGISVGKSLRAGIGTTSSVPRVVGHIATCAREFQKGTLEQNLRNFLTALIIASAPSLTLNTTCCSCINAMVSSACFSKATDSNISREISKNAIGRNSVLFDPSGLSTSLVSGTMLARSHSRVQSLFAKNIIHI